VISLAERDRTENSTGPHRKALIGRDCWEWRVSWHLKDFFVRPKGGGLIARWRVRSANACATPTVLPFLHQPVGLTSFRPRGCLHLETRH
jgi:hypothetical protein